MRSWLLAGACALMVGCGGGGASTAELNKKDERIKSLEQEVTALKGGKQPAADGASADPKLQQERERVKHLAQELTQTRKMILGDGTRRVPPELVLDSRQQARALMKREKEWKLEQWLKNDPEARERVRHVRNSKSKEGLLYLVEDMSHMIKVIPVLAEELQLRELRLKQRTSRDTGDRDRHRREIMMLREKITKLEDESLGYARQLDLYRVSLKRVREAAGNKTKVREIVDRALR